MLARGLARPLDVAVDDTGAVYASESGKGRVVRVDGGVDAVIDGLQEPHGVAASGNSVYALDRGAKTLIGRDSSTGQVETIAEGLPVGDAAGIVPKSLPGIPGLLPGPIGTFAGLAAAADGTLYVAADGEGSVMSVSRAS